MTGRSRLFLALWPDPAVRAALEKLQAAIGERIRARPVNPDNLHITLKFLGAVPQSDQESIRDTCRRALFEPCSLVLDRVGCFPRSGIVWVGTGRVPESVERLVGCLDDYLAEAGIERERRYWRPHCTLFRRARRCSTMDIEPIRWVTHSFVLAESTLTPGGPRYQVRETFPAGSPGNGHAGVAEAVETPFSAESG